MKTSKPQNGVAVVLSGGGCKTFWSLGALDRLRSLLPNVSEWAGVSAGAAMAAASASDKAHETLDYFCTLVDANEANVYPQNILRGPPVFPHEGMYRETILHCLGNGGFDTLLSAAPVRILLAHFAHDAPKLRTIFGAVRAYRGRKKRQILHGPVAPYPGLVEHTFTAQDCSSKEHLCDIIMASSSTPPLTGIQKIDGRYYADGAMVDHAPVRALSSSAQAGKVLVFSTLSVPINALPRIEGRLYLTPSRPLPIAMWDYANPHKVKETFEQGRSDAEQLVRPLSRFLEKEG